MSRVVKGGQKFKPVARPKVARPTATPTPAPESQPVTSSQDGPSSSQVPELTQSSTQALSLPSSSFPATPGSSQAGFPPPSLPPAKPSSTSAASVDPSTQTSTTSSQPIPLPPARAYNPYLHDSAPPPIIIREPVRSAHAGPSSSQPPTGSRPQGRGPPTIASTPEPSSLRAGSVVPMIATTQAAPPSPGGEGPSSRARAPPRIASTPAVTTTAPPPAPAASQPARHARPPSIATTSDSSAMPPPAVVSKGKGKPTSKGASAPAGRPRSSASAEPEPVASTSAASASASLAAPATPRGRGRGLKKSVLDLDPSQSSIVPPVSAERGVASEDDRDDDETDPPSTSAPPGKGRKRGPAAGAGRPAAKRARASAAAAAGEDEEEADEPAANEKDDGAVQSGDDHHGESDSADGPTANKRKGKGKAAAPKRKPAANKRRKVVDSDNEAGEPAPESGDDAYTDAATKPKAKRIRKAKDPNAPPPKKRQPVEKDIDGNVISRANRKPANRKKSVAAEDGEVPPEPRPPKPPMQGPLNEAGDAIPRPRVRKPRTNGNPIGRPKKAPEPIEDIPDIEAHNALVGDGPDASTTTMKDICIDTGMGRISSRYIEIQKKAMDIKEARKAARLRMKSRLSKAKNPGENDSEDEEGPLTLQEGGNAPNGAYVRPEHAAGSAAALDALAESAKAAKRAENEAAGIENPPEEDEDDIDGVAEGAYAPQFRLVNGEMILDQESLVADRHAETEARGEEEMEILEERDTDRFVNSTTWGKKLRGEKWSVEETDLFYDAINQFGTDFEMIARLFPGRTRKMIKNKWNREEVINANRVTDALMTKVPVDMATYSRMTRTDLSGPPPVFDAPPPPPPSSGPRPTSTGPRPPPKKKRANPRDGEEVVGMVGEDGEVVRADGYESPVEDHAASVNVPSWARAKQSASAPPPSGEEAEEEMPSVAEIGRR